jgi:hypothetical protein
MGRHIGQAVQFLVQHLRDHADFLVLKLCQESGRPIVGDEGLTRCIGIHEHTQRDIEPDAVILFEQLRC